MPSNRLLRVLGVSPTIEHGVARFEKSLFELKHDVDAALAAFRAKIEGMAAEAPELSAPNSPRLLGSAAHRTDPAESPPLVEALLVEALPAVPGRGPSFDPISTYVCLSPSGAASTIDVTPEFWATVDQRADVGEGRLVAVFACDPDPTAGGGGWEMHPHGEEVLVLLAGRITLVLEGPVEQQRVELNEGRAILVPRATWHRAVVHTRSKWLAITYGRGTLHRAR